MKSKIKQLLVGVLAVAVISSNFVAALIPNAATIKGTIAVTENKTVVASTTDTTVDVPVKVTFTEAVTGPHGRFSITADGATLTNVKVDSFNNANAENPDAYVRIGDEYGADGTNLKTGTILVESAIDNKAAVVTYINLVATFTVPANTAAGTVIPVTVKGIDATNANEDNWEDLDATNGNITVTAAEPEKTVADYIANVDITNSAENQSVTGTVSYTVETTQALFSYVKGLGGEITALGLRGTWDGSDPTTSTTGAYAEYQIPAGYFDYFATNGWAMPNLLQVYYTGMNVAQFNTDVKFAASYTYKDANGVSHVEYLGDVLTYSFNDLISGDTTDLAVAYKELYNTISGE